jgi:hypothetical protein
MMHFAIFFTTGIFFWKWSVALGGILIGGIYADQSPLMADDGINSVVMSAAVMLLPFVSSKMATLAWFDSPVSRRVRFVLKEDGQSACINPYDIMPYDLLLSQVRQENYFRGAMPSLECFGANYDLKSSLELYALSDDQEMNTDQKLDRVRETLNGLGRTIQSKYSAKEQVSLILDQLLYNLSHQRSAWLPNYHVWNGLPRSTVDQFRKIIRHGECSLTVERCVYFYCAHTKSLCMIDKIEQCFRVEFQKTAKGTRSQVHILSSNDNDKIGVAR